VGQSQKKIAVFIDFDNQKVAPSALINFLKNKGQPVVRRAYADWVASSSHRKAVVSAGFDLIDCPKVGANHKNATDIRMALDCLEVCYEQPLIDMFVLVTGDADVAPLINKLRVKGKQTMVVVNDQGATSDLLKQVSDEFVLGQRLNTGKGPTPAAPVGSERALELYQRAITAIAGLGKSAKKPQLGYIKQVMLDLNPAFDESDFGFKNFKQFNEWARAVSAQSSGASEDASSHFQHQGVAAT